MRVIIDIPKEAYNYIKDNKKLGWLTDHELADVIANSIPLTKNQEKLITNIEVLTEAVEKWRSYYEEEITNEC